MKSIIFTALFSLLLACPSIGQERVWNFDSPTALEGWDVRQTHPTSALATWQRLEEADAPSPPGVLALIKTENEDPTFNLAIAKDSSYGDLDLSVRVKATGGEIDQGGGPIWRCRDENNYYICRFNPLESNFRLYFVKDGMRRQLDSARVVTKPDHWYSVRVTMEGDHILGYLDGRQLLEATDSTFGQAGRVGLWTKADACTSFDDLSVHTLRGKHAPDLMLRKVIDLPGVKGRIDHLSLDLDARRLYVAALGNGSVEVINLDEDRPFYSIKGLDEPQGIHCLPSRNLVVAACAGDGTLRALDTESLEQTLAIDLGDDADNVRFDPQRNLIWVGAGSGALTSAALPKLTAGLAIALPGHPESFQFDSTLKRAFVNVADKNQVCVVDLEQGLVTSTWDLGGAQANFPMAVDNAAQRIYVGCRHPAQLLVLDTNSGAVVAQTTTVGDADDIFLDPKAQRAFIIGGEGFVDVFSTEADTGLRRLQRIPTAPGARTGLWSPEERQLFVAVPEHQGRNAQICVFGEPR